MKKKRLVRLVVFLVIALIAGVFIVNQLTRFLAPEDSSALYGGQLETGYEMMGFMVIYENSGQMDFCGVVFTSRTEGISAAHCFDKPGERFVGLSRFNINKSALVKVSSFEQKPGWDSRNSNNDLAKFRTASAVNLYRFGQLTEPQRGCNYRVVAYGRTEDDVEVISPERPRKSASVCLNSREGDLLTLTSDVGGICVGDSGSPIFEEGSNKFIGVVSAVIKPNDNTPFCYIGNTALVPRVDTAAAFLGQEVQEPTAFEGAAALPAGQAAGNFIFTAATALGLGNLAQDRNLQLMLMGVVGAGIALLAYMIYREQHR